MHQLRLLSDVNFLESFPTFPFELPLKIRPLRGMETELVRPGEGSEDCDECAAPDHEYLWVDRSWRLRLRSPSPLPGLVMLYTRMHFDSLADLPDELAVSFGPLAARIERAVRSIDNVGRVHIIKGGDGHAHFHVWFYPRPCGMNQLRGAILPMWGLLLEPAPEDEIEQAGHVIASALSRW